MRSEAQPVQRFRAASFKVIRVAPRKIVLGGINVLGMTASNKPAPQESTQIVTATLPAQNVSRGYTLMCTDPKRARNARQASLRKEQDLKNVHSAERGATRNVSLAFASIAQHARSVQQVRIHRNRASARPSTGDQKAATGYAPTALPMQNVQVAGSCL